MKLQLFTTICASPHILHYSARGYSSDAPANIHNIFEETITEIIVLQHFKFAFIAVLLLLRMAECLSVNINKINKLKRKLLKEPYKIILPAAFFLVSRFLLGRSSVMKHKLALIGASQPQMLASNSNDFIPLLMFKNQLNCALATWIIAGIKSP